MITINETSTATQNLSIELAEYTSAIDDAYAINNYEGAYTLLEQYELLVEQSMAKKSNFNEPIQAIFNLTA